MSLERGAARLARPPGHLIVYHIYQEDQVAALRRQVPAGADGRAGGRSGAGRSRLPRLSRNARSYLAILRSCSAATGFIGRRIRTLDIFGAVQAGASGVGRVAPGARRGGWGEGAWGASGHMDQCFLGIIAWGNWRGKLERHVRGKGFPRTGARRDSRTSRERVREGILAPAVFSHQPCGRVGSARDGESRGRACEMGNLARAERARWESRTSGGSHQPCVRDGNLARAANFARAASRTSRIPSDGCEKGLSHWLSHQRRRRTPATAES